MNTADQEASKLQQEIPPAEQPLAYRAARNAVWAALGSYWVIGFGFIANILLIRLLTPAIYGEFALAMFFYTLFDLQGKVGLNFAFAQQRHIDGETVGTLATLSVLLGTGTLLVALLAVPILVALGYPHMTVVTMVIMCGLSFVGSWLAAFGIVLETTLHLKPLSIATAVATPLSYLPAFWLALQGLGQYSLVSQHAAYSLAMMAATLLYILLVRRDLLRMRWRYWPALARQYLRFGVASGMGNFLSSLLTTADNFILGTIGGATTLGYYDRAYRLAQWPALLLNTVIGRAAVFTYAQVRDVPQRLQRSVEVMLWISAHIATPIALALFLSAPDLVRLLFGEPWLPSAPLLRILLLAAILRPLWENVWAIFIGIGMPKRIIELSIFQLVVLAIVGAALSMMLSATGTALAVVLMFGAGLTVAYHWLQRIVSLHKIHSVLTSPLVAAALTLAGYLLLVRLIGNQHPLWFSVAWKVAWGVGGFMLFS
ncbi:MAG: oligosaccharide flippase family protein, partial [Anaerolineae bacterium]|nr:oligosaccharide flippase family protein [Thermoflexales bacterium]MDW8408261.1 oligosaccharide flippase family protein [Anaerolineae bacterium]